MAARLLSALALACVCAQADHFSVPLTLHPGDDSVGAHTRHGIASYIRTSGQSRSAIEPETFSSNKFWYGGFQVGDSKNLSLAIDTGSTIVEVNPGLYKPTSQAVDLKTTGKYDYIGTKPDACGSLDLLFDKYIDTMSVQNIVAKSQYVASTLKHKTPHPGEVYELPPPYQGIVGLAGNDTDDSGQLGGLPFFANLCNQSAVAECRFGVAFGTSGKGQQIFGGVDDSLFTGSLSRTPALGQWNIKGAYASNGKVVQGNQSFILDTGTPNVVGPMGHVQDLFKEHGIQAVELKTPGCFVPKVLFGYYKCDAPPTIGFTVGDEVFNIQPSSFRLKNNGNNNCTATLVGIPGGADEWLIGQAWMQGTYFDFDAAGGSVAAAPLKDPSGASY